MRRPIRPATVYLSPERALGTDAADSSALVEGLRQRSIPAVVCDPRRGEAPIVRVALDADDAIVVADAAGELHSVPSPDLLTSLASLWGVDLLLEATGVVETASHPRTPEDGADGARVAASGRAIGAEVGAPQGPGEGVQRVSGQLVYLVLGEMPSDPARRRELAQQLEASLTIVPLPGGRHVIVPHTVPSDYWPPAQRPVLAIGVDKGFVTLRAFTRGSLERATGRENLALRVVPDLTISWMPEPRRALPDAAAVAEVQDMLASARIDQAQDRVDLDREQAFRVGGEILTEFGVDRASLTALLTRTADADLVDDLAAVLGLPAPVVALVRGEHDVDSLPGAHRIERTSLGRLVWEQSRSRPSGPSWLHRIRGFALDHPRLAVGLTAIETLVVGILVFIGITAPPSGGWNVALWMLVVAVAIDVASDVVLLVGLWRRRRST
ncbi:MULTISPECIES: hypothetical protein [unclassified Microbacterium]|uniref:hypothetical protein n=1 Tax=unclassified Microbacterium TaxID=2609290 RepID=UPI00386AF2DB